MTITVTSNEPNAETLPANAGGDQAGAPEKQSEPAGKPAEQDEATETVTETPEAGETSDEDEGEGKETEAGAQAAGEPKKKSGSQRQKERAERAEAELARTRRVMEEMALKGAGTPKPEDATEPAPEAATGEPDPNDSKFDTHAKYVAALTDWKVEQKLAERDRKANEARLKEDQAKAQTTYYDRAKAFAAKNPDFDQVLENIKTVPSSPTVKDIIFSSENGPALAYELAKDPEEFARLCSLPPIAAAVAIGEIKHRLAAPAAGERTEATKKITKAPAPLEPVQAGGKGAVRKSLPEAAEESQAAYEALRLEQMKRRRAS